MILSLGAEIAAFEWVLIAGRLHFNRVTFRISFVTALMGSAPTKADARAFMLHSVSLACH